MLWGCSSVHLVQLDTMRPAQVDYHINKPQLVVVNNSPIPNGSDYSRYIDENGKHYRLSYNGDSIPGNFAIELAHQLYESQYFESVDVVLSDSNYITGLRGIDRLQAEEWLSQYPYSVHLAINDIRPCATMRIETFEGVFGVDLQIATTIELQCFVPCDTIKQIAISDTLVWYSYGETPQQARNELPTFEECIHEALASIATRTSKYLTPYKHIVDRYIFVTGHTAMQDAHRYWDNGQHTEASYIWEYIYEKSGNRGRKAKAAANLALYYELNDDYTTALDYARKAHALFIENNDMDETEYAALYCSDLERRIKEKKILDQQVW